MATPETQAHRITIEPTRLTGEKAQRYAVRLGDEILLEAAQHPEFEACRALVTRGLAGRLEVWRMGGEYPSVIIPDLAAAAF
jgi:hypothetical protein